ncbi:LiaF transmembrane domain-containing protein [Pseudogracilibacillus sp. SO10305]|uniref:LiaF transmembrane domain-containing protein n=1 Tax=Pseudogracilibacillus sp. SO10305 TaxID=3098292 RepID=UPI00300DF01B
MSGQRFVGILIVIFGIGLLLQQFDLFDFTTILANWWPIFFILVGIIQIWTNGMQAIIPALIFLIVGIMLLINIWIEFNLWQILWPFLLIMFGLSIIFSRREWKQALDEADEIHLTTFLSGIESINGSKNLSGGSVLSVLGGIQLDLRHAQLTENGAVLNVTTILGGVELIVPEDVHVEIKGTPILGGWENKTNTYGMEKNKTLYINGVALLGGIEIKH